MVRDAEFLLDDLGNAGAGPHLAAKPVGLRPMPKELRDETLLSRREFGRVARRGPGQQGLRPAVAGAAEPTADGDLGGAQGLGDVALTPALLLELVAVHQCRVFGVRQVA
jgi:hypothetical protein